MPYNPETEQFFQAPATIVDSTPDGDTVQEGFDDRLTPAMAGVYTDLNLLKENGMIGVGIPATTTSRGIGRVATLADMEPGAIIENGPAFLSAGDIAVETWIRWISRAIGEPFALRDDLVGVSKPPNDNANFRYIKLTAGENGSGGYNEGILINETVSGSAPLITATAEINMPESPLHGQTVNLINTEGRYIKPGTSPGTVADDQTQAHGHNLVAMGDRDRYAKSAAAGGSGGTGALFGAPTPQNNSYYSDDPAVNTVVAGRIIADGEGGSPRTGNHTDVRHQQATYYMRIM